MEGNKSGCATCKHETLPSGIEPCCYCLDYKNWEPKEDAPEAPVVGIDPGAPEGDKTNIRRVWPLDGREIGPELIGPQDITSVDQLKDGPLAKTAKAYLKQITRLDYAIAGVWSKISSNGIKLTDKTLSRDELTLLVCQLNALQLDLFELEDEREAMMKGGEHGNGND